MIENQLSLLGTTRWRSRLLQSGIQEYRYLYRSQSTQLICLCFATCLGICVSIYLWISLIFPPSNHSIYPFHFNVLHFRFFTSWKKNRACITITKNKETVKLNFCKNKYSFIVTEINHYCETTRSDINFLNASF